MVKEEIIYADLTKGAGWWVGFYGRIEILGFDISDCNLYLIFKVFYNEDRNVKTEEDGNKLLSKFISSHTFNDYTSKLL